ncbi:MAG TPA: type I restriction-modification enzyme R subunit C-terminal domain-containing protein [Chloroflexota bacterium]|nr:type I restriction-modification enzyme R subunit C-terminal domain-containing protein [Chloroflexota bacterium]
MTPEQIARQKIDELLRYAGWQVQDREAMNLWASPGVAVREAHLQTGFADYLLFVEGKALGVIEAKKVGVPLSGVEIQSARYAGGLRPPMQAWRPAMPLPFRYESTGVETFFTNGLDPEPRARRVFAFHRPETLQNWAQETDTLRQRLRLLPPLPRKGLWGSQIKAITKLEQSLAQDRPRALIQMATGSGKTFTAVNFIYRLIKHANARRVLFLVDRNNLGKQAHNEFVQFDTPDDGRKFAELYNIRHLTNNALDVSRDVNRVYISTIQRLYALLKDEELDEEFETQSLYEIYENVGAGLMPAQLPAQDSPGQGSGQPQGLPLQQPVTVSFTGKLPIEFFDIIIIDECHRSIYTVWRQVLEYFDAHLIGLTATPGKQTIGFFNQNLVMEYTHDEAVVDGINVGGEVYRILTRISDEGSTVEAGHWVGKMDRLTREQWQEKLDEALTYTPQQLDRDVVSESQMRTIIRHFRDVLFTELFPDRADRVVPKTLIFAKDDNHAENVVRIVREEFGKGNDFCQKITYRASRNPEDILQDFRNSYHPRIAVTVDMIATGTDVRAIEILLFMRQVRSRGYFEQMRGRGTRVIKPDEFQAVTADARHKTHFVLIDAVGLTETEMIEPPHAQERQPTVPFDRLLENLAYGQCDAETVASLAHRLARLQHRLTADDERLIADYTSGGTLPDLIHPLLAALDDFVNRPSDFPNRSTIAWEATEIFRTNPNLRQTLLEIHQRSELVIDNVSLDVVKEAGFDSDATEKLRRMVGDFQQFIADNKDEITALQILYNQPHGAQALTRPQLQELAQVLQRPPHLWTEEKLWAAYAQLEKDRVRGLSTQRVLTDLIALVRHALQPDGELAPYPEQVQARYAAWLAAQEQGGKQFNAEQRWWLDKIAQYIGLNLQITPPDFDVDGAFVNRGGRWGAMDALGADWLQLLDEMNAALVM